MKAQLVKEFYQPKNKEEALSSLNVGQVKEIEKLVSSIIKKDMLDMYNYKIYSPDRIKIYSKPEVLKNPTAWYVKYIELDTYFIEEARGKFLIKQKSINLSRSLWSRPTKIDDALFIEIYYTNNYNLLYKSREEAEIDAKNICDDLNNKYGKLKGFDFVENA